MHYFTVSFREMELENRESGGSLLRVFYSHTCLYPSRVVPVSFSFAHTRMNFDINVTPYVRALRDNDEDMG